MDEQFIKLLQNAQRWNEAGRDYMPTFGCSSCGKGCLPLCGLGMHKAITPMESKDLVFQTRKTMLETGKPATPVLIQVVTGTGIVVKYEEALQCIEDFVPRGGLAAGEKPRKIFVRPIPTLCGLLCKDCDVCQICGRKTDEKVFQSGGGVIKACCHCTDVCRVCKKLKVKYNMCCLKKKRNVL
jgi:hypothetical protein